MSDATDIDALRAQVAELEQAAIRNDERHAESIGAVRRRAEHAEALLARIEEWTHTFGAELKPSRADTYGEGVRDSKDRVGCILTGAHLTEPLLLRCVCAPDNQDECCPQHGRFATLQEAYDRGHEHEKAMTLPEIERVVEERDVLHVVAEAADRLRLRVAKLDVRTSPDTFGAYVLLDEAIAAWRRSEKKDAAMTMCEHAERKRGCLSCDLYVAHGELAVQRRRAEKGEARVAELEAAIIGAVVWLERYTFDDEHKSIVGRLRTFVAHLLKEDTSRAVAIVGPSDDLYECVECSAKPGTPTLCVDCLRRRAMAGSTWRGKRPSSKRIDLDRLAQLMAAATPAPWCHGPTADASSSWLWEGTHHHSGDPEAPDTRFGQVQTADAELIVAMREALPAMIAELRLAAEVRRSAIEECAAICAIAEGDERYPAPVRVLARILARRIRALATKTPAAAAVSNPAALGATDGSRVAGSTPAASSGSRERGESSVDVVRNAELVRFDLDDRTATFRYEQEADVRAIVAGAAIGGRRG